MSAGSSLLHEQGVWAIAHAAAMIVATAGVYLAGAPHVLAAGALVSMLIFVWRGRGLWTPRGTFGAANATTALRLLATLLLLAVPLTGVQTAAVAFGVLALDVADGWVARRFGWASQFGAEFDVEADALLVLSLSVLLALREIAGAWVLVAGLWRYVYVLTLATVKPRGRLAERSILGRVCYVVMVFCFLAAFVMPPTYASAGAALGAVAASVSFLLSFWKLYVAVPSASGGS